MFATLSGRLTGTFTALNGKARLSEADIDATCRQIRIALLEADVALPVVKSFIAAVKQRCLSEEVSQALNPAEQVIKVVHAELTATLGGQTRELALHEDGQGDNREGDRERPTAIMLVGLQGAGKTTLAGKLARRLSTQGHRPLLVAADLFRPGAVDQLTLNADRAGVDLYAPERGNGAGDPVEVAAAALEHATAGGYDVVILDTAGRTTVDEGLMDEAVRIREAISADEVLLVLDSMTGQDAARTAGAFHDAVSVTGLVLTKLDGDTRGGAALSLAALTGRPIMFASIGEKVDDLEVFHPDRMASRILDLGDMLTLIEKAETTFAAGQADSLVDKLTGNGSRFTLDDFVAQMQAVRAMGPLTRLAGLLPGMGQLREQLENIDEKAVDRMVAIINSMTPAERTDPEQIDERRRGRIAAGAGCDPETVTVLIEQFLESRKMMVNMLGEARTHRRSKTRRGSGNPAKRAAGL